MTDPVVELSHRFEGDAPTPDDPGYAEWVERVWPERFPVSPEVFQEIDRALILENLRRTPSERLAHLERRVNELLKPRGG